jgi:hypothetical protein
VYSGYRNACPVDGGELSFLVIVGRKRQGQATLDKAVKVRQPQAANIKLGRFNVVFDVVWNGAFSESKT